MTPDPEHDARWAWGFVVLSVAAAILGQFVGVGIARLLGYGDPEVAPPLGPALLITVPTLLISIAPSAAAVFYGIRAGTRGRLAGYAAAALGGLTILFWVGITTMALVNRAPGA